MNYVISNKSSSAYRLAKELGVRRITLHKSKLKNDIWLKQPLIRTDSKFINFGVSKLEYNFKDILNKPEAVARAVNKKNTLFFLMFNHIPHIDWETDIKKAMVWLDQGFKVYCRRKLCGTQGAGIVIASTIDELVPCRLYTKGEQIKREYRIHVFNNKVIDFVAKAKKKGCKVSESGEPNPLIQNHKNGWVFVRNSVKIADKRRLLLQNLAIRSINALGLDFGAVDILLNVNNQLKVIEINTAPGISGLAFKAYINAIRLWWNKI